MAHVIAVCATKGGVGKTTIAGALAVCAVADDERVAPVILRHGHDACARRARAKYIAGRRRMAELREGG
jgi:molybdopterin-guanine dinucleotide biosynthesis protein